MRMLNDNVLVALNEEAANERVTDGGIILTGQADDDKSSKPALVLAVGPLVSDIEKGDTVFLDWAYAMPVTVAGNSASILQAKYVKAVM